MIACRLLSLGALAAVLLSVVPTGDAKAVPSFAAQTGYPCTQCHVGGFGPLLTPFGRAFKIGGYTQDGGEGWASYVPLSAFVLSSFTATNGNQPAGTQPTHFGQNDNFALDQISVFLAGRITDWAGIFSQFTYNGTAVTVAVDNTDVRPFTMPIDIGDSELRVGVSVNNNPTVQDPYNSTFAWGFPYVSSALAPVPAASPVLAGGFAANSVGVTAYAWYDKSVYLEVGGYDTLGPNALRAFGANLGPGSINGVAPYLRAAYEWDWNGQAAHVGALFFSPNVNPATAARQSSGALGTDTYTDFAVDAGYQYLGDGTHRAAAYMIYTHENQDLKGTEAAGGAAFAGHTLDQLRINGQYWYQNTYGVLLGWQGTWGTGDPVLYAPAPVTGSRTGKPDSSAFIAEADWVPFGKDDSWGRPFANLRLGIQYTAYTEFNGATHNYDGFGRNASDNNTLYLFAWLIF